MSRETLSFAEHVAEEKRAETQKKKSKEEKRRAGRNKQKVISLEVVSLKLLPRWKTIISSI